MPIYEFMCNTCGREFEKIQSFSETTVPTCPQCEGVEVARRLSKPAIHFKGSGWYITDSKNNSKENGKAEDSTDKESKNEAGGESSEGSKSKGDSDTSVESTSKSKPEKATTAESTSSSTSKSET